jgi:hypothetical protein
LAGLVFLNHENRDTGAVGPLLRHGFYIEAESASE